MANSELQKRLKEGLAPETPEHWQELAAVITSLSTSMHHVYAELDAAHEVLEEQTKAIETITTVLEGAGFHVKIKATEDQDHLRALMEALGQ